MGGLSFMRERAKSKFIKILLYTVAFTFVFGFGAMTYVNKAAGGGANWAAKVDGTVISIRDYRMALTRVTSFYRQQYGEMAEQITNSSEFKMQILNQLVQTVVLAKEAEKRGIKATESYLQNQIYTQMQRLQGKDGKFDKKGYFKWLQRQKLTPEQFEEQLRIEATAQLLKILVSTSVKVSDEEVWDSYLLEKDTVSVNFMNFSELNSGDAAQITSEQAQEYFEKHEEEFAIPETRKIQYLELTAKDFESELDFTHDDIEQYYHKNKERFYKKREKVKAAHILFKISGDDPPALVKAQRDLAEKVHKMATAKKADFAALAKKFSQDDTTKDNGGDLGWIFEGKIGPTFSATAFALLPGDISGVVEEADGFHIIKVFEKEEGGYTDILEVADEIKKKLTEAKALDVAMTRAEEVFEAVSKDTDLVEYGNANNIKSGTSSMFKRSDSIEGVERPFAIVSNAFGISQGEVARPIRTTSKVYVIKCTEINPERIPDYGEVEQEVKSAAAVAIVAEQARQELANGTSADEVAAKYNVSIDNTGPFSKNAPAIPKLGRGQMTPGGFMAPSKMTEAVKNELIMAAFSLTKEAPVASKLFMTGDDYAVIWLDKREKPNKKDFEQEKEMVASKLIRQREMDLLTVYIDNAMENSKVEFNPRLLASFTEQ